MVTKTVGVYAIANVIGGKRYIGSSTWIEERWRAHRRLLNSGDHHNAHLQAAWKKHGEEAFLFRVIVRCSAEDRFALEQHLMDRLAPEYNISKEAHCGPGMTGRKHSLEARKRMSEAQSGRTFTVEHRARISAGNIGNRHTEAAKKKISASKMGHPVSPETRAKIAAVLMGNKNSNGMKAALAARWGKR